MKGDKRKDNAMYVISLIMIFFANFILLPAAFFLVILTVAAFFDKNIIFGVIFLGLAVLCVLFNRLIIKNDDRWEKKKAKEKEEFRQSQIIKLEVTAKSGRSGKLEFAYDPEEETMTVSRKQLRPFNNDSGFEVISYNSGGKLSCEVEIIDQIYRDEDKLLNSMRKVLFEFYQKEGAEVKESDALRIQITELIIEKEKKGYYVELKGEHEDRYGGAGVKAKTIYGSDEYKYVAYWI